MSSDTRIRSRLRKQIRWLCRQLASKTQDSLDCPPNVQPGQECEIGMCDCAECWRKAARWAVKEEGADGTSEETPQMGR